MVYNPLPANTAIGGRSDKQKKAFIVEKNGTSMVKENNEIIVNTLTITRAKSGLYKADLKIDFRD